MTLIYIVCKYGEPMQTKSVAFIGLFLILMLIIAINAGFTQDDTVEEGSALTWD